MSSAEIPQFEQPEGNGHELDPAVTVPSFDTPEGASRFDDGASIDGDAEDQEFGGLDDGRRDTVDGAAVQTRGQGAGHLEPVDELAEAFTRAAAAEDAALEAGRRLAELLGPDAEEDTSDDAEPGAKTEERDDESNRENAVHMDPDAAALAELDGLDYLPPAICEADIRSGAVETEAPLEVLDTPESAMTNIVMRYNERAAECPPDPDGHHGEIAADDSTTMQIDYHNNARAVDLRVVTGGKIQRIPIGDKDLGTGEYIFYEEVAAGGDISTLQGELDAARAEYEGLSSPHDNAGLRVDVDHPAVRALCREQFVALKATGLAEDINSICRDRSVLRSPLARESFDYATRYHLKLSPKDFGNNCIVPRGRVVLEISGILSDDAPHRVSHYIQLAEMSGNDVSDGYTPNPNLMSQAEYSNVIAPLVAKMLQTEQDVPGYDPALPAVLIPRSGP